jgi:hypothetical protein
MSTATGLPANVSIYLEALGAELADLAPEERDDLISEVEPSLLEAAAEGDEPIAARLGPPAEFARESAAAQRSGQRRKRAAEQDEAAGRLPPARAGGLQPEPDQQREGDAERQRPGLAEHELAQLRDHAIASRASVTTWSCDTATSAAAT